MLKLTALLLCMILLCGCNSTDQRIDGALEMRKKISSAETCQFECTVTADYSDIIYTFTMNCSYEKSGNLCFSVISPESISGICGSIDSVGGKLTFDDKALAFPLLADGQLSPVSAPWYFMKTLCSGYIRACGQDGDRIRINIDDTYEEKTLQVGIWTDEDFTPVYCEFLWQGRRILTMDVKNFSYM